MAPTEQLEEVVVLEEGVEVKYDICLLMGRHKVFLNHPQGGTPITISTGILRTLMHSRATTPRAFTPMVDNPTTTPTLPGLTSAT